MAAKNDTLPDSVREKITGVILAGGAGRRAGNRDKGTIAWRGQPLVAHVYQRLSPQVGRLIISCNRNPDFYREFSTNTVPDRREDYQGPLAGLEAAQEKVSSDFVLLAPCDSPLLPLDLARRLFLALEHAPATGVSYAAAGGDRHYLCALLRSSCLQSLTAYLDGGGRAVRHWFNECGAVAVEFEDSSAFLNINEPD